MAQANNRRTWSTFATAVKFYLEGDYDGIGFVFSRQDNYIGIDIDKCVVEGKPNTFATEIIDTLDSYRVFSIWYDPVIQNNVDLTLEIYTESEREWIKVNNWNFILNPFVWDDLTSGSSYTIKPEYHLPIEESVYPKDLHKYTGSKEPITKSD